MFCCEILNPGIALLGSAIGVSVLFKCSIRRGAVFCAYGDWLKGKLAHQNALRHKKSNGLGERCTHGIVEALGMLLVFLANAHLQDGSFLSR